MAAAPGAPSGAASGTGIRVSDGNSAAWRRAQIPAASGFGNARSVAAVQSVLACGGTARGVECSGDHAPYMTSGLGIVIFTGTRARPRA